MAIELLKKLVSTPSVSGSEKTIATRGFDPLKENGLSPQRKGGIVGEPNGMEICVAQKGALVLNLIWKGKGAHAAHGTKDHAIRKCIEDLSSLSSVTWPRVDPFLGETRLEVTQVHAGERVNVIP